MRIDLFLQPGIPPIEADQNQLRQVFHNLLSNSMEAVPDKDKLVVSIRASVVEDEGNEVDGVELDVSDKDRVLPIKFSNMRLSLMSRRSPPERDWDLQP